jgi:hypothetical protein
LALTTRSFLLHAALRRGQADKCFQQAGRGGGALDELASSDAHGTHNDLRLVEISDGKHCGIRQFLMQKFHCAHRRSGIIGRNIDHQDIGISGLHPAHDRVRGRYRKTGAGMDRAGHAGSVHQHLEHGALLVVSGDDYD